MRGRNISLITLLILLVFTIIQNRSSLFQALEPVVSPTTTQRNVLPIATSSGQLYPVAKVVDGDTLTVTMNNKKEKVRLIGINSPETVDPRRPVQCFGKEASIKMKEYLTNRQVRLIPDPTQDDKDKYGRLLRYVYRDDGMFINLVMVSEGYAYEYTYDVPYQFQAQFKNAQKEAENSGKGLWADDTCGE